MRIAFVVQRYGLQINGGAELHCRWVAEHMQKYWDVEVLTTNALDYVTWKNHYPKNEEAINGIPVKRFPVMRTRDPVKFGRIQNFILENEHKKEDEIKWLEEEGPFSPGLIQYIKDHCGDYSYFIFFSYRYFHSYWGIHAVPQKSILVPTAERDAIFSLSIFKDLFRRPRGFIYNSVEEKEMITSLSQNGEIPGDIVGVGTEVPGVCFSKGFRDRFEIRGNYMIYIGRIDENKGADELFDFFLQFKRETDSDLKLVLVGSTVLKIPFHPDIIYLGFLGEEDKFAALKEAMLLVMPSFFESLSMVTLEAWAMKTPVLANARCEVLKGQCLRSRAGLYYENYQEFRDALRLFLESKELRRRMGVNGQKYFRENYTWDIIEKKYLNLVNQLENLDR